jgi:GNAT superfamily N-acetyltransferase
MDNITYKHVNEFNESDIKNLYEDAGWTSYTKDLPKLMEAIDASLMVISAWDDENLIGLSRVVGDGLVIIYIQDILVLDAYKRKGIGSKLLKYVLENYKDVRQKVLLTDDGEDTRVFYEANGFVSCDKGDTVAFIKFN